MVILVAVRVLRMVVMGKESVLQLRRRVAQRRIDGRVCGRRVDGRFALAVLTVGTASAGRALLTVAVPVMSLDVFRQVVRTHEPFIAYGARKTLLTRMSSQMPLQLVGPREPLPAEQPVADKRPLARVPAQMGLQVGRLPVHFATAGNVTGVDVLLAQVCARWPQSLRFLTVGTVARGPARVPAL